MLIPICAKNNLPFKSLLFLIFDSIQNSLHSHIKCIFHPFKTFMWFCIHNSWNIFYHFLSHFPHFIFLKIFKNFFYGFPI
ncbi:hypothetical protein HanRHA438_Chr14g0680901 [Helianthus annuus]|nr:hypothetical protein HanRHA438_Chr14g0680901 [Helianthus annuus]